MHACKHACVSIILGPGLLRLWLPRQLCIIVWKPYYVESFASSASARLYLKQVYCFGKQQVGHTGEVLREGVHLLQNVLLCVVNVSICFSC